MIRVRKDNKPNMRAIVYCRVSSKEQVDGYSLGVQEKACQEYCERKGYLVDQVFVEEGESAKTANRTQLLKALEYCRKNKNYIDLLIVHKLDRFARNVGDHAAVKATLTAMGVKLESVSEQTGDDANGRLMENVFASFAQWDNEVRGERCSGGMRAMLEAGYWPWAAPYGYKNDNIAGQPILTPIPETRHFIAKIYQDYLNGLTIKELSDKYTSIGMTTSSGKPLKPMLIIRILENPLYCGLIDYEPWGVTTDGKHEALISKELFMMVKSKRLKINPTSKNMGSSEEFPLRGTVYCSKCNKKMTASVSTGKLGGKFPYYHCFRGCKGTYTSKQDLEQFFFDVLKEIQLSEESEKDFKKIVMSQYEKGREVSATDITRIERDLESLKQQKATITEKYSRNKIADDDYQEEIGRIKNSIIAKEIELNENKITDLEIETVLNNCKFFLMNISHVWKHINPTLRTRLQSQILPKGITYSFDGTFRTPELSPLFRFMKDLNEADSTQKSRLVDCRGFEPRTPALQRRCSTK